MKKLGFIVSIILMAACSPEGNRPIGPSNANEQMGPSTFTNEVIATATSNIDSEGNGPSIIDNGVSEAPTTKVSVESANQTRTQGGVDVGNIHVAPVPRVVAALTYPASWSSTSTGDVLRISNKSGSVIEARKADIADLPSLSLDSVKQYLKGKHPERDYKVVNINGFDGVRAELETSTEAKKSDLYLVSKLKDVIQIQSDLKGDDNGIAEGDQIISAISLEGSFSRCILIHEVWPRPVDKRGPVTRLETLSFSVKSIIKTNTFFADRGCKKAYSKEDVAADTKDNPWGQKYYESFLVPQVSKAQLFVDHMQPGAVGPIDILDVYGVMVVGYSTYRIENDILKIARTCRVTDNSFESNYGGADAWEHCRNGNNGLTHDSRSVDFIDVPEYKRALTPAQIDLETDITGAASDDSTISSVTLEGRFSRCDEFRHRDNIGPKGVMRSLDFSAGTFTNTRIYFSDSKCEKSYSAEDAAADMELYKETYGKVVDPEYLESNAASYKIYLKPFVAPGKLTLGIGEPVAAGPIYFLDNFGHVVGFSTYKIEDDVLKIARICQAESSSPYGHTWSPAAHAWKELNNHDSIENCKGDYGYSPETRSVDFAGVPEYRKELK